MPESKPAHVAWRCSVGCLGFAVVWVSEFRAWCLSARGLEIGGVGLRVWSLDFGIWVFSSSRRAPGNIFSGGGGGGGGGGKGMVSEWRDYNEGASTILTTYVGGLTYDRYRS